MTKKIRARSLLIGGFFTLFFVVFLVKLYWIQVVDASWLREQAAQVWETDRVLAPERGSIMDRNDKMLAVDSTAYTVSLDPQIIDVHKNVEEIVQGLTGILLEEGNPRADLEAKIRDRATKKRADGTFVISAEIRNEGWKIDKDKADQVKEFIKTVQQRLKTKYSIGIHVTEDKKRYYPGGTMASQLLGYTNKEGNASQGLEVMLDEYLKGTPGKLISETDAKGVELLDSKVEYKPAINGQNVRLTIDKNIQFYMETALEKVYEKYRPKSLMAIAVDPQTMEVLGMANVPNFNPNQYWNFGSQSHFLNNTVAARYEPGSTFKLVTLAGAIEEGLFDPNEMFQSGSIRVTDRELHDHNYVGWGKISMLDGLKRSSNVAFVKLGYEKLKSEKLKSYINKFGFGEKTNIDIPGEVNSIVSMQYPSEFATATYGQGKVVVTAIQQTAAYAAIANGGKLMKPYVVKDILDPQTGEVLKSNIPTEVRQVVSASTAKQVSEYLEQVVSDQKIGTGKKAFIDGYRVAGKTGTAQKVIAGDKGYSEDKWVISFVGYAPVEDPRILVTIIADEPELHGNYHNGGDVAAPAFKEIVTQTLQYMGVSSSKQVSKSVELLEVNLTVPDFTNQALGMAKEMAKESGVQVEVLGKGTEVLEQFPKAGTKIGVSQRIYLVTQQMDAVSLPDLSGKSLRDAMEVCSFLSVSCQTSGQGYVTKQTVTGEGAARIIQLELQPLSETAIPSPSPTPSANDKKSTANTSTSTKKAP
jgi:penicillin-binding protein 2B